MDSLILGHGAAKVTLRNFAGSQLEATQRAPGPIGPGLLHQLSGKCHSTPGAFGMKA